MKLEEASEHRNIFYPPYCKLISSPRPFVIDNYSIHYRLSP